MNQYNLRKLEEKDYFHLKKLWFQYFSKDVAENRDTSFNWIWRDNPFKNEGDSYVVMEEDNLIIAYEGIMPYHFSIGGKDVDGYIYQDTMVDPSVRGKGIGTRFISAMLERYKKFSIVVWMNGPSARVFEKCGWKPVSNIPSFVRVYNAIPFATKKLGMIGKPLGLLVNMGLKIVYVLDNIFSTQRANPDYEIEVIDEFDERIDELFKQVRSSYFCISYRGRDLLNWRYAHSNSAGFKNIICTKEAVILSYLVYRTRVDKKTGKTITTIYDYLSNGDEGGAFSFMFRKAMVLIEKDKPDQIEIICTSEVHIPALRKNFFFRGWDNPLSLKYSHTEGIDHAEKFADGRNWFFTYGDGDRLFWDL